MRTDPAAFAALNQSSSKRPLYVVELAFDFANTDRVYFTSHREAATPAGALVHAGCVGKISSTSQEINPDRAVSTIGAINIELIDLGGALTALFAGKSAGGDGLRQKRVRVYVGYAGLGWEQYQLVATQVVDDLKQDGGSYSLRCADIQRTVRKEIFTLASTTLSQSISAEQLLIPVYSVEGFQTIAHGSSYTDRPGVAVGYLQIGEEVIRWTHTTTDPELGLCFVVDTYTDDKGELQTGRGALNTAPAAHTVDPDRSKDRRTEVKEYVYLELPAVKLAYALLTGNLYNQPGARLPEGWHLGVPGQYIRTADFTGIGADLWNPDDDTQGIIVRFAGLTKQDGKQFIEQELLLLLAAFMPVYADGQLGLRRMTSVLSGAASVALLDEHSVVSHGELHIDTKSVHNVLSVLWNYQPEQDNYSRQNLLLDEQSIAKYGRAPVKEVRFKGLHGSRHTDAVIGGLFDRLRDRYAGPPLRLSLKVLPSRNVLEVGDVVRVRLPTLRDPIAGGTLDRAFEVQQVRIDWHSGEVNLKLFGSSEPAGPVRHGNADGGPSLPDSFYTSRGTNLATYPGVQIQVIGGVGHIRGGSGLVGGETLEAGRYYYDGDLELDAGVTLPFSRNVMLCVKGHFQINGILDGAGRGLPGAAVVDADYASTSLDKAAPALEPYYSNHWRAGLQGYLGSAESGGGHIWHMDGRGLESRPGYVTPGRVGEVPYLTLAYNDDALQGLPAALEGSSGATGAPYAVQVTSGSVRYGIFKGGAGGNGGAGMAIVSRGASFGEGGRILTGGADGAQSPQWEQYYRSAPGTGGGGGPGAVIFVMDGGSSAIPDVRHVHALLGRSPVPVWDGPSGNIEPGQRAIPLLAPHIATPVNTPGPPHPRYSYYVGAGDVAERHTGAARVLFAPATDQQAETDVPAIAPQPLTVSVVEYANTPRSAAGNLSTLEVTVGRPDSGAYSHANIYYRIKGSAAWEYAGAADDERTIVVASDGTTYEVQARSVSISRQESPSGPIASITVTNIDKPTPESPPVAEILPVPDVRGLELYGQANDTDFTGRDAKFVWRESSVTEWQALGWDAAKLGARDLYFRDYEVTVHDIETGQIRRTEHVVDPEYTYSFEKNVEDSLRLGLPGPRRQFRVEVVARGRQSQVSRMPARITVQNPAPELPAGWSLTPGYFEASAHFRQPDDTDFRRVNIYLSEQPGFTPGSEYLVWSGADSPARLPDLQQGTTYYYRYQAEDAFGPGALSGELSFTTQQLALPDVSGVQEAISDVEDWLREHDDEFAVVKNGITSAQQAIADETQARTVQYNALDARVTDAEAELANKASVTYVDDAVADEASARATAISQVNAELGDVGAAVTAVSTALADLETGLSAEYTLTVDAGGNVTGIKLRSGESGSSMVLQADAFAIATQGGAKYPFTIENDNITFNGRVSFSNVEGRPTSLADLDSDAATKLGGIAAGADKTKTVIDGGLVTTGTLQLQDSANTTKAGITAAGTGDSAVRLWAGETFANRGSAPFRITQDGKLVATGATISGQIAGESLVTGEIQSPNFVEGVSGWRLSSDGSLEANDAFFRGTLGVARISAPMVQIMSPQTGRYGRSVAVVTGYAVYDGGSTASEVAIGGFYLPGHPTASTANHNFIATQNGAVIIVSGLIQLRQSRWGMQYRRLPAAGDWTGWAHLDDAPIVSLAAEESVNARIFPFSFGINIWGIASPTDREIQFRLYKIQNEGGTPRLNSWRLSMWYSNL